MTFHSSTTTQQTKEADTITFHHFWTQTELCVGAIAGMLWAFLDFCLGGIDTPIKALAILICMDFITGVTAGYRTGSLSSRVGAKGLLKKGGIFLCIIIACLLDMAMSMHMFRGMVISAFATIEAMSLVENVDRMGYGAYIPEFFRVRLKQIADEKVVVKKEDDKSEKS